MNNKNQAKSIAIFVALSLVGVGMVVLSAFSSMDIFHKVFPYLGSALFASGLTFFLVEMTRQVDA